MPTWLGILLLGNLLGRRRRSFGRSLLFGGLLGWLFHRNFDLEEMQASVRGDTCVLTYRNRSFSVVTEDFFSATVGQTYPALNIRSISVTIICVASSR